ncbi:MAG: hypothetical protein AB8I58_24110 [Anaerolineales bacterium]
MMETAKRKFSLGPILFAFCVVLFFMAERINMTNGANADQWVIPIIMAVVGLVGALIGGVLGGMIGLAGRVFKKHIFTITLKYGAAIGFMLLIFLWFFVCLRQGSAVCIAQ